LTYSHKDIAIVILNWNGRKLLETFLPSVIEYSDKAKLYIADNASTDDSIAFLKNYYPNIKIIKNKSNGGYAKGYNDSIKHVIEPIVCLLNSDVEVTDNWLDPILETFNADKSVSIVQPKILDYKKKAYFEYAGAAGGFIDKYCYPFCRGRIFNTIEKDEGQYNDQTSIFWASGACFFIKNNVFKSLGGFDETYFAHMEEIDLCWRAYNQNFVTKYTSRSIVYHVGGATLKNTNPKKTYLNFRNSLITLAKNTDSALVSRVFTRMVLDGIAAIRFLFQLKPLFFVAVLKAHGSFYWRLRSVLKQRKKLKKRSGYFEKNSIIWSYFIQKNRIF